MDVNGLPMWQFASAAAFGLSADATAPAIAQDLYWKAAEGHVRLAQEQEKPLLAEDEMFARRMMAQPSPIADRLGGFAWWDADGAQLLASGFEAGAVAYPVPPADPPSPVGPSDFAFGVDEVVYAARDGTVIMVDSRDRWPTAQASRAGFRADMLAPYPDGGAWAFDRSARRLARVRGHPLRFTGLRDVDPDRFDPVEPNPDPPRLLPVRRATIPADVTAVAMASSPGGQLALLGWKTGEDALIYTLDASGFTLRFRLSGLLFPWSIAWIGEDDIAVMASDGAAPARQAFVYPMTLPPEPDTHLPPDGRFHLLMAPWAGGFCNALAAVPSYLATDGGDTAPSLIRALRPLSGGRFARSGSVLIGPIDSARAGCVWHRLYAEASLPSHGRIEIAAWATDSRTVPALPGEDDAPPWATHVIAPVPDPATDPGKPLASWCPEPSELPFHPGLLHCPSRPGASGLFTVLLQHGDRRVRRLTGRYLWLVVTLAGDGQGSPELAALRVYANRLSWRDRYLPAFYREALGVPEAAMPGPATPNDFLDRMLCLFESDLTPMEGRVASSWLLTDPAAAPADGLGWLGSWIGVPSKPGDDTGRLRQALLAAPYTAALHGTLGGLMAALEIATGGLFLSGGTVDRRQPPAPGTLALATLEDVTIRALVLAGIGTGGAALLSGGAVTRGEIVVVEGFRLRRTFATILGADLADESDPLTLGMATSGNSFVGDTLILGEEARDELLALYRPEIDQSSADAAAVAAFYDKLAHRVLVLVRDVTDPAEMTRLGDVVAAEIPAHVEPQIFQAHAPLIVGAASLVGIDTFLAEVAPFERVRLGVSSLANGDYVAGSGMLDRRADGPVPPPPVARADGPAEVWSGKPFVLSAARSSAAPGRSINRNIWTWN